MKLKALVHLLTTLSLLLPAANLLHAQTNITFKLITTFQYPGATYTVAMGIDDTGNVVGYYNDLSGVLKSFERYADGTFSAPIVVPGDTVDQTIVTCINNNGTLAGFYSTTENADMPGFFYNNGTFTFVQYPGAYHTIIQGINDAGDYVGYYLLTDNTYVAFANIGGVTTTIEIPDSTFISPNDINNDGDIVGWYGTAVTAQGFRFNSNGLQRYPILPSHTDALYLYATNDLHSSVGASVVRGVVHGLFYGGGQIFATYDLPGTSFNSLTGVNAHGSICGWGFDNDNQSTSSYIVHARSN